MIHHGYMVNIAQRLNDRDLPMTISETTHAQWVVQPIAPWLGPQLHITKRLESLFGILYIGLGQSAHTDTSWANETKLP